jgi:outer membrane receptor protein involved in Fe transport
MQYNRRAERGIQVIARDLPVGGETSAGATDWTYFGFIPPAEQTRTTAVAGGYVEELIGFRDRLFLTGALRFDGGSAFGQNFSLAVYPKASISWVVTDGQVGPHLPGVSTLRLRTAYGVSGVQPGPTAALQQMRPVAGVSGNAAVPAAQLGQFGNPNLKPERASEIEAGVDVQLTALAGRLELTAYQRTNHDALINRELAPDVGGGFGSAVGRRWENLGSVRNRGLELLLSSDVVRGDAISAGVTVTGSLNDNKLLELGKGIVVSSPASQGNRQDVGYPLQGLWGRTLERYSDANGNGIIEPTEIVLSENHYIGPAFPTREATAAPYVGLFRERLRLSALLHYRGGNYVQSPIGGPTCSSQYCRAVNDISTPLSEQARAVSYSQFFASGEFTEPASYVMLREVSMNFTAPPKWARMVRSRDARLVVAGRNVAQIWRQGTTTAVENDGISRGDRAFSFASITGGAPTYWVLRLHVTY